MDNDARDWELIPAAMLNALTYCPRLFYLQYVQGERDDSADTIEGCRQHCRADVCADLMCRRDC